MEKQPDIVDKNILQQGYLDVGDGHQIYWVDWGNPDVSEPIFYLHGGPGGGFDERYFTHFNPKVHRVVFHDQRGSNRSLPFAETKNNTSSDLVSDITKLRKHLGFDKVSLYGFSWGSTLALLYALANPDVVKKMLIGGIYLSRDEDAKFLVEGGMKDYFPEVWERFSARANEAGVSPLKYYHDKMLNNDDPEDRREHALEWMVYEFSLAALDYVPMQKPEDVLSLASESIAYLEAHYILNNCFVEEGYILDNIEKIQHIPTVIVHGRYDAICRPSGALTLKRAMGDNCRVKFITCGHLRSDMLNREVVNAYVDTFLAD